MSKQSFPPVGISCRIEKHAAVECYIRRVLFMLAAQQGQKLHPYSASNISATFNKYSVIGRCCGQALSHFLQLMQSEAFPCVFV